MKKTYVKPFASFESFELSSSIAGTCVDKTYHALNECGYKVSAGTVFVNGVEQCDIMPPDGKWEGLCYHNSTGTLFTS